MYYTGTLGTVVAKVEWVNAVLQTVKPENEFSQFSLYLGPRCAGNRNPDLQQSGNSQEPRSLYFGAYPSGFHRGLLFAGVLAGSPHLGPVVGGKNPRKCYWQQQHHHIQANMAQMNISAGWLFLYHSWHAE